MSDQLRKRLTPRQRQVLNLLAKGHSEKETAKKLKLSPNTVHGHVKDLHVIFGVSCRGELLATVLNDPNRLVKVSPKGEHVLDVDVVRARRLEVGHIDARTARIREFIRTVPTAFKVTAASFVAIAVIGISGLAMRDSGAVADIDEGLQTDISGDVGGPRLAFFAQAEADWNDLGFVERGTRLIVELAVGEVEMKIGHQVFTLQPGETIRAPFRGSVQFRAVGDLPAASIVQVVTSSR